MTLQLSTRSKNLPWWALSVMLFLRPSALLMHGEPWFLTWSNWKTWGGWSPTVPGLGPGYILHISSLSLDHLVSCQALRTPGMAALKKSFPTMTCSWVGFKKTKKEKLFPSLTPIPGMWSIVLTMWLRIWFGPLLLGWTLYTPNQGWTQSSPVECVPHRMLPFILLENCTFTRDGSWGSVLPHPGIWASFLEGNFFLCTTSLFQTLLYNL